MKKRGVILVLILLISILTVVFAHSLTSNSENRLKVTSEHPFFVDESWIPANQLKVGDLLTTIGGQRARITNIKDITELTQVFNFHVNGLETYFANDILVHNKPVKTICQPFEVEALLINSREPDKISVTGSLSCKESMDVAFRKPILKFGKNVKGAKAVIDMKTFETWFWNGENLPGRTEGIHHPEMAVEMFYKHHPNVDKGMSWNQIVGWSLRNDGGVEAARYVGFEFQFNERLIQITGQRSSFIETLRKYDRLPTSISRMTQVYGYLETEMIDGQKIMGGDNCLIKHIDDMSHIFEITNPLP